MDVRVPVHRRLALQLGLAVALVTALAFAVTGGSLLQQERKTLTREFTRRVLSETRSLSLAASAPLLRHDPELGLHPLILKALEENPSLRDLVVLDREGRVQGHRELVRVGTPFELPEQREDMNLPLRPGEEAWRVGGDLFLRQTISHLGQPIGSLVTQASLAEIDEAVAAAVGRMTGFAAAGTALAILAVVLLVASQLRPLHRLREGMQRLGRGDLSTRVQVSAQNELGVLSQLVNSMAAGLESAQGELIQKERMDKELEIARQLQEGLIPQQMVPPRGYGLEAFYMPALEVSGDYYDLIPLEDGRLAFVAADVSGKGVPGLVVMAMLRIVLRGLSTGGRSPIEVLLGANAMLHGSIKRGMFVSCLYGILDPGQHRFEYASAGHCPPALFGRGPVQWLPVAGKPIGLFPDELFRASLTPYELQLQPGDGLLLYTDGLVEAMGPEGEQLGTAPVEEILRSSTTPTDTIQALVARVDGHRDGAAASDDLTLMIFQRETASRPVSPEAARC